MLKLKNTNKLSHIRSKKGKKIEKEIEGERKIGIERE